MAKYNEVDPPIKRRYQLAVVYSQERGHTVETDLTANELLNAFLDREYDKYEQDDESYYEDEECFERVIVREYNEEYDDWELVEEWPDE